MADIFVSDAHEDGRRVQMRIDAIEERGWSVCSDRDLQPGDDLSGTIRENLRSRPAVVVCWSAAAIQSTAVREGAALALVDDKLVPLSLDQTPPPKPLRHLEVLDLSRWLGARGTPICSG